MAPQNIFKHAFSYAELGSHVFPLASASKLPAIRGGRGFKDATNDVNTIEAWAKAYPHANIGIATGTASGIVVIDIDPRNGGLETIASLKADGFTFPRTPTSKTGNGGWHLFFKLPAGELRKTLGPGLDVKADGGYVVAPPSEIGPSSAGAGGRYEWIADPWTTKLAVLPQWMLERLTPLRAVPPTPTLHCRPSYSSSRRLNGLAAFVANAPQGQRNCSLNWAAFRAGELVAAGDLDRDQVANALMRAARAAGLPDFRSLPTLSSGLAAAIEKDGSR